MKSRRKGTFIAAALLGATIAVPLLGQSSVAQAQAVSIDGQAMSGG